MVILSKSEPADLVAMAASYKYQLHSRGRIVGAAGTLSFGICCLLDGIETTRKTIDCCVKLRDARRELVRSVSYAPENMRWKVEYLISDQSDSSRRKPVAVRVRRSVVVARHFVVPPRCARGLGGDGRASHASVSIDVPLHAAHSCIRQAPDGLNTGENGVFLRRGTPSQMAALARASGARPFLSQR